MHIRISSHGLKRSCRSCPRRVNAGNKNTPSTHHPRRRNVTTLMVGLKKRSHTQKSHPKVVNPRDIAGERNKKKKKKPNPKTNKQNNKTRKVDVSPGRFGTAVVGCLASKLVYLTDGSTQTIVRAATLRYTLQINLCHPVTVYRRRANQSQR